MTTNNVLEIPIDTEEDNLYFVYFLHNSAGDILYIGKTTRLRARIRQHLLADLVKLEPWRETVDRNNIETIQCANACDMDLYETYLINKYKPIYNKDKVFNCLASFEFPYIEPVTYKFQLKSIVGIGNFRDNCIRYVESEEDREILADKYPVIKQAYEQLGSSRMRALAYSQEKLIEEINFKNTSTQELIKNDLVNTLVIGQTYYLSELKELMNSIYLKYSINKKGKAVDVGNYLKLKFKSLRDGKEVLKVAEVISL